MTKKKIKILQSDSKQIGIKREISNYSGPSLSAVQVRKIKWHTDGRAMAAGLQQFCKSGASRAYGDPLLFHARVLCRDIILTSAANTAAA